MGGSFLDWSAPPIGVYAGDTADDACKSAAKDHGEMGTFFAVEGYPWGLELMDAPAKQLGKTGSPVDSMAEVLARMENRDSEITALLEQAKGNTDATPTE